MKGLLKTIFIFFALVTAFCFAQQETFSYDIQQTNYIQNDYQKVVLVSNSMRGEETLSNPKDSDYTPFWNANHITSVISEKHNLLKTPPEFVRESIHNISTNLETDISIRAP